MFAGIIENLATISSISAAPPAAGYGGSATRLCVALGAMAAEIAPGASVALNGVCLTLVGQSDGVAAFDAVPETMRRTNLGGLRPGDPVNVERSLRVGDRVDGHFVQGHVECVGRVRSSSPERGDFRLTIETPAEYLRFIIPKGSVAIDGVSMTVVDAADGAFSVVVIPTTWRCTTLGIRRPGDSINIETDILSRTIVTRVDALLGSKTSGDAVLRESLRAAGVIA
ncbi:MAG: riboflavin synthase [Phycisphaerales bacterium]|nr:riboflavin synthase [Phycisphaerales bacterium]